MLAIERRSGLSYAEFEREYLKPRKPVILCGALDACAARTRWTPAWFRERFGERIVNTDSGEMSVAALIDKVLEPQGAPPFLRERPIPWLLPELLEDLAPFPIYGRPNWLEYPFAAWPWLPSGFAGWPTRLAQTDINLTGANVRFPILHLDRFHCHALILQWHGRKEFFAFAPEDTDKLYPDASGDVSAITDPEHPDLERFPRFAEARMLRFTLMPGEILFNPTGWWHTTRTLDVSIATVVSFGNASNWARMVRRMWPTSWKGRLAFAPYALYLRLLGWLRLPRYRFADPALRETAQAAERHYRRCIEAVGGTRTGAQWASKPASAVVAADDAA
ncbi:MAG: cupin-like domain-containing protein [Proteobacteria bacterium]|nr:cupin-like domain-containing protein [Pseudomonadota bacterium]